MFQPDPNQWPIRGTPDILPPQFRGGVAPLRFELSLSDYLEKQRSRRLAQSAEAPRSLTAAAISHWVRYAGGALIGAVARVLASRSAQMRS